MLAGCAVALSENLHGIEQVIVEKIIKIVLSNLEESWDSCIDSVNFELVCSRSNPHLAAIVAPDEVVMVSIFEVKLEVKVGSLIICLSYPAIEPIWSKVKVAQQFRPSKNRLRLGARLKEHLLKTSLELAVNLDGGKLTGNQLLRLKAGDVITLDTNVDKPLAVTVDGAPRFLGGCKTPNIQQILTLKYSILLKARYAFRLLAALSRHQCK